MKDKFKNQVIVVTGAGNGIGKAIAKSFALAGGNVVVNDIKEWAESKGADFKLITKIPDIILLNSESASPLSLTREF